MEHQLIYAYAAVGLGIATGWRLIEGHRQPLGWWIGLTLFWPVVLMVGLCNLIYDALTEIEF